MSRVPRIRFKGFEEDWEQRKLREIFKEYSEKNHVELPPLTIIQGGGTIRRDESDRALQYDKGSLSNYKMVNKDDFIVHLRSFEGGLEKANSIGIISPAYYTFSGENTDTTFYYTYFRSKKFVEIDLKPHVYGIRDGRSIDIEGMKTIKIPYTIYKEQMCIGKAIDVIDHLITLHQRKLKKLKNIKKSMLENLFPKNGEKTPRIRFSGFTEDWEQRKLGELATYFEYGLNVAAKEYDGENKYIRITDIDDESHEFRQDNLTSPDTDLSVFDKYKLSDGDLLFSRTGASVGNSYIYKASDGLVYYAGFLIRARIKEENNSEFVYQNTLTSKYVNFIKVTSMRSGQPGVNAQEYSQFEIRVPSKVEQDTITYYFSNLDHLITLHQSKLEKLQKIKKSMLESMFV